MEKIVEKMDSGKNIDIVRKNRDIGTKYRYSEKKIDSGINI